VAILNPPGGLDLGRQEPARTRLARQPLSSLAYPHQRQSTRQAQELD